MPAYHPVAYSEYHVHPSRAVCHGYRIHRLWWCWLHRYRFLSELPCQDLRSECNHQYWIHRNRDVRALIDLHAQAFCKFCFGTIIVVDVSGQERSSSGLHRSYFYTKTEVIGIWLRAWNIVIHNFYFEFIFVA